MRRRLERTVLNGDEAFTVLAAGAEEALVVDGRVHWLSASALDDLLEALTEGQRLTQ